MTKQAGHLIWFHQLSCLLGLYLGMFPFLANKFLHALLLFGTVSCFNSFLPAKQELGRRDPPLTKGLWNKKQ